MTVSVNPRPESMAVNVSMNRQTQRTHRSSYIDQTTASTLPLS